MTEETTDFAAFEAAANAGESALETPKTDGPHAEAKDEGKPDDTLELTEGDEAVEVPEGEEGGEETQDADGRKRRNKPAAQRIAELTAKLRDAERKLEARDAPPQQDAPGNAPSERPKPDDFEFGEADPAYIEALTDWKIESREADRSKAETARAEQAAQVAKINDGIVKAEASAKAKYEDFDAKIASAVEARGGEPLPPILSIGVSMSPVGGDILYRLATDDAASERIEALADNPRKMALAFGELEGEFLADDSDDDLDLADELDMARLIGRQKARMRGAKAPGAAKPAVTPTNAPEPPQHRARGGSGRFEVDATTSDFAAFEQKVNGKR